MVAKIYSKFLWMLVVFMASFPLYAESGSSQNSNPPANGSAVLRLQSKYKDIKRMPSANCMEIFYSDGVLSLLSDYYDGEFSLCFENCESGESHEVSSILVGESVAVELNYGEYVVTAINGDGIMLSGFMQVY